MNAMKKLALLALAALTGFSLFAGGEPLTVSDVTVTPIKPFGLAIDYMVFDVQEGAEMYAAEVTLKVGDKAFFPRTLFGDANSLPGPHRLYWNLAADGIESFENATVKVDFLGMEGIITSEMIDGVSATVIANGSKISDTVTIDCAPIAGATVSLTVNGAAVTPAGDAYEWLPNKVGENKLVYTITDANNIIPTTFTVTYDAVERAPEITAVQVQKVAPFGLAIDYTYTMMQGAMATYAPVVTATTGEGASETVYTAKTLTAPQSMGDGKYRVYWNMAKDGIGSLENAKIAVTLKEKMPEYCVVDLGAGSEDTASYGVTYQNDAPMTEGGFNTDEYKTEKLVLKRIEAGSFIMGDEQENADHTVTLTQPFYMAIFETTQRQWGLVTGSNPSKHAGGGERKPVDQASYNMIRGMDEGAKWPTSNAVDGDSFLGKLRARAGGLLFDLPTEAQWEYACRAGTKTHFNLGDTDEDLLNAGWYFPYSGNTTHNVGEKQPNAWDLYDMHGNVWELCLDWWDGSLMYGTDPKGPDSASDSYRVARGGCYADTNEDALYASNRGAEQPWSLSRYCGFRLALPVEQKVSNVCEVKNVTTSVVVDGAEVTDTLAIEAMPSSTDAATVTVDDGVVLKADADAAKKSGTYRPAENGAHTIVHRAGTAEMSVTYNFNLPPLTVSGVSVQKIEPFGLAIDYTVANVMAGADAYAAEVTLTLAGGTKHVAKTLSGDAGATAGSHRLYWNLAADGIASFTGGEISVTYVQAPYCVIDLSGGKDAASYPVTYLASEPEGGFNTDVYKTSNLVLKRVEAGSFIMGEDQANELHKVTLTRPFYMALFETTQAQWQLVMGENPSYFATDGEKKPVEQVSYNDIRGSDKGKNWPADNKVDETSFLGKLRAKTGLNFDLPTEAQWEYACRAGTKTKYNNKGDTEEDLVKVGWYLDNSHDTTHDVGALQPNYWGLYDMHGNVFEWCLDWCRDFVVYGMDPTGSSSGSERVLRGGTWRESADYCASYFRLARRPPSFSERQAGFRLSRTMPATPVTPATVANVSATVIANGSKISDKVKISGPTSDSVTVALTVNGNVVDPAEDGSYEWLPNKVGANTLVYTITDIVGENPNLATFTVTYDAVERAPEITAVQVQKIAPFGLAIDYTYTMMEGAMATYTPAVTATTADDATVYTAKTLTAPQSLGDGKYRVYWNMAKDGVVSLDGATVAVWLRESSASEASQYCVIDLSSGADGTGYSVTYLDAEPTAGFNTDEYKTTKLVLKRVDAGSFIMGEDQTNESHRVTISQPFYLGLFETTQKQWELVKGSNPSYWRGNETRPVEQVSYYSIRGKTEGAKWPASVAADADSFLGKLRSRTGGLLFDLPTEAQWEYACRAGTNTKWSFGDEASVAAHYMWYNGNSYRTIPVGSLQPNGWGFYDMHGNVFEWCLDRRGDLNYGTDPGSTYVNSDRMVTRGGSCLYAAERGKSFDRSGEFALHDAYGDIGFRLAMMPQRISNVYEVSDVTTSVLVDGAEVTDTLTIDYVPTASEAVSLLADGDSVVDSATAAGVYSYRPTANGAHTIAHTVGTAEMSVTYNFNLPPLTVSGVSVQKIAPFGLAIDYTVADVMAGAEGYAAEVTLTLADGTTKHVATTLSGNAGATAGNHRLYWNLAADGIESFDGATVSVTYKDPLAEAVVAGDGAKYCVIDLTAGADADKYSLEFMDEEPEGGFAAYDEYKTTKLVLKRVEAGEFVMGEDQTSADALEKHKVTLTKAFYMALFETTQKQWDLVMGAKEDYYGFPGELHPAEMVSYDMIRGSDKGKNWPTDNKVDSTSFLGKLRARTGLNFDLPTEAQWEYACRAGTNTKWSFDDGSNPDDYMSHGVNSEGTTHNVGERLPNKWGFYDMHGNVWEWCLDWYDDLTYDTDPTGADLGSSRVIRGGSWVTAAELCASSYRFVCYPSEIYYDTGFRLSRTMPATPVTPATAEGVSATVIANGSKISDTVKIDCAPIAGATVTLKVGETDVTPTEGNTYEWLPNKVGENTLVYTITDASGQPATFTVTYEAVERAPEITAVSVSKVAPFGLAIDYTYTMMEDATATYAPAVTATTGTDGSATVYTAKTLTAPQSMGDGKYRVYWNMAKDGIGSLENAKIGVTLKEKIDASEYCVVSLADESGSGASSYDVKYLDAAPEGGFNTDDYKTTKLVLKRIEAGSFIMGDAQDDEEHRVTLTKPFYMAIFETTQKQWELVMGENPCSSTIYGKGDGKPVHYVSYNDIRGSSDGANWPTDNAVDSTSFLGLLRARTDGLLFDLPTEAQWEYACRAGTKTVYNLGKTEADLANAGWYKGNSRVNGHRTTHNVGEKQPNNWGLYDMHGNVQEWCLDWCGALVYGPDPKGAESGDVLRVLRGGSAWDDAGCTSFARYRVTPSQGAGHFGFRLALPAAAQKVSNVYEVENVTTSVIKDGETVTTAIEFDYLGTADVSVTITAGSDSVVEGVTWEGKSEPWQPSKPGRYDCAYSVEDTTVLEATYTMSNIPMKFSEETLAAFNYVGVYDGAEHGIALTNKCDALKDIANHKVTYATSQTGSYEETCPTIKNVGTITVWYFITAPGYETYVGEATVTITPRPVTLQSGTKTDFVYDGNPHGFSVIIISENPDKWFVADEGVTTLNWATVTNVADGEVVNTFDYAPQEGTILANYTITKEYGKIAVQPLDISGGDEGDWQCQLLGNHTYDGRVWTQGIASATFKELPVTFEVTDNVQKNAGSYKLTLTGTGNFTGTRKVAWSIGRQQLDLTAASGEKVYDGSPLTVNDVTARGFVDGEGATYVINSEQTKQGESENVISGINWNSNTLGTNYEVTKNAGTLTVTKRKVKITSGTAELVYNGEAQTHEAITIEALNGEGAGFVAGEGIVTSNWATVTTVADGEVLNEFDYEFDTATSADNYEVTVDYGTVKIVPKTLTEDMFSLTGVPEDGYVWDGTAKEPEVSSQDGDPSIITSVDYTVAYADNTDVGEATVTITGKNNYTGAVTLTFAIGELLADVTFDALGGTIGAAGSVVLQQSHRTYGNFPTADPTRENYVFKGWYLDVADDATQATADGQWLATGDHTLYARWEVDPSVLPSGGAAEDAFDYSVNEDGTVTVTGLGEVALSGTALVIPDMIDGKFVTAIGEGAFANSTKGITSITLPMFLETVGRRAFSGIKTLTELNIPSVRKWNNPSEAGTLTIDSYAFTSTGLTRVRLPAEVSSVGDYAFADCRSLTEVTILGAPTVGTRPFRRAGINAGKHPTVWLDPALANTEYLAKITQDVEVAVVRTDAVIESVSLGTLSVAPGAVRLSVAVGRAADWGEVDASRIRVEYRERLGDEPTTLVPSAVTAEADGSLAVEVAVPEGSSGFFRVKVEE